MSCRVKKRKKWWVPHMGCFGSATCAVGTTIDADAPSAQEPPYMQHLHDMHTHLHAMQDLVHRLHGGEYSLNSRRAQKKYKHIRRQFQSAKWAWKESAPEAARQVHDKQIQTAKRLFHTLRQQARCLLGGHTS